MRGSQFIFNDVFSVTKEEKHRKGRSDSLNLKRNECLIYRYCFFAQNSGLRYELLIKIVSQDFWLSETTVRNVIAQHHSLLITAKKAKESKISLKKRWPQMSWELPRIEDYI